MEFPVPAAAEDGMVLKVDAAGVCGTDGHLFPQNAPYPAIYRTDEGSDFWIMTLLTFHLSSVLLFLLTNSYRHFIINIVAKVTCESGGIGRLARFRF